MYICTKFDPNFMIMFIFIKIIICYANLRQNYDSLTASILFQNFIKFEQISVNFDKNLTRI